MSIIIPDAAAVEAEIDAALAEPESTGLALVPPTVEAPSQLDRIEALLLETHRYAKETHTAMTFLARQAMALQGSPLAKLLKLKG
jgi:hypothetical protein